MMDRPEPAPHDRTALDIFDHAEREAAGMVGGAVGGDAVLGEKMVGLATLVLANLHAAVSARGGRLDVTLVPPDAPEGAPSVSVLTFGPKAPPHGHVRPG